jgi:thermitase
MIGNLSRLLLMLALVSPLAANAKEYVLKQKSLNLKSLQSFANLKILDQHEPGRLVKVDLAEKNQANILARLLTDPNIEYVVPNFKLHAFGKTTATPVDALALKEQWANNKVHAKEAWELANNRGSRSVIVAVIDTGVDYNHETLAPNMVQGYDFRDNDADPMDETSAQNPGHGTHCSGSIAGTGLVDGGIEGLSPVLTLMPIRFLGADGSGDLMDGIKSIDFAIEKGAHVISASWGATVDRSQATPLIEAVQRADDAGIIFVAAAANDGRSNDKTDVFPANSGTPNMISVAASGSNDEKPSWSNYGKATVSLAAPGLNIMSTLPQNRYGNLSGTSMATPLVAGLVALLKAQDMSLTGQQIRSLLQVTGTDAPIDTACNCRVNAKLAMDTLVNKKPWIFPAAITLEPGASTPVRVLNSEGALTFTSSNSSVASVDSSGLLTAQADGETVISVTDSAGNTIRSRAMRVAKAGSGGGGGGGDGEACPFDDPELCEMMCQVQPTLPWCK